MSVLRPDQGTGFTSLDQYLDANQDTLAHEGEQIGVGVGSQIDQAHTAADQVIAADREHYSPDYTTVPGYKDALDKAIAAKTQATALGSEGGVSDYFQKQLHDSDVQGAFDARLLGASGKLDAAGLQGRASGLIDYLNHGLAGVPAPTPPEPPEVVITPNPDPDQPQPRQEGGQTTTPDHSLPPPGNPGLPGRRPRPAGPQQRF